MAQVSVNTAALQQLAGIEPPPKPVVMPVPAPVHHWVRKVPSKVVASKPAAPVEQAAAHVPVPQGTAPEPAHVPVPQGAAPKPAAAAQPAAPAKPAAPQPPKPPAPVSLTFAPGSSTLPASAAAALKPFCTAPGMVSIDARAPAVASDPSAAMRLSLARAFAVRDALAACGMAPQNILPRADGAVPGQNEDTTTIGSGVR